MRFVSFPTLSAIWKRIWYGWQIWKGPTLAVPGLADCRMLSHCFRRTLAGILSSAKTNAFAAKYGSFFTAVNRVDLHGVSCLWFKTKLKMGRP